MPTALKLPLYVCHKEVRALKIKCIREIPNSVDILITPEDWRYPELTASTHQRPKPEVGWYFIQYADGYTSFSPAKAFEDGYKLKA